VRARLSRDQDLVRRAALAFLPLAFVACRAAPPAPEGAAAPPWERESPLLPFPRPPLGMEVDLSRSTVKLSPEKVRLGRWLFYDVRLSADHTISCASCHPPARAFSDAVPRSKGVGGREGVRKAPSLVNAGFPVLERYFWDGRAASLAEQARGPITNPVEMANTAAAAVGTIAAVPGYRRAFRQAYGDERVGLDRIADAIAAYEATRLSGGSAFDRFNAGDAGALPPLAQEGLRLFFGRGRCNACHLGPGFSDSLFHNVGIGFDPAQGNLVHTGFVDTGRYAVTGEPADIGAFKTPTLRDVSRHPPYMHDGSSPDLADAVLRYVRVQSNPWLDPAMEEVRIFPFDVPALVAFLEALDGSGWQDVPPAAFPQ
jgi:cytochrome c peroxidase